MPGGITAYFACASELTKETFKQNVQANLGPSISIGQGYKILNCVKVLISCILLTLISNSTIQEHKSTLTKSRRLNLHVYVVLTKFGHHS